MIALELMSNRIQEAHLQVLFTPINCDLVRLKSLIFLDINPSNSAKASNEVYVTAGAIIHRKRLHKLVMLANVFFLIGQYITFYFPPHPI